MEQLYFELLKQWCDALIKYQIRGTGMSEFDGALRCPACKMIHGRCHDAVYPLMYMADKTGDERYLTAAKLLFDWGENMLCDDGSLYNDAHSTWNGITVFAATELCEALEHHSRLLDADTKAKWEKRLVTMGDWLYHNLTMELKTNINYHATCAGAMALLGNYLNRDDYKAHAQQMAYSCVNFISENGLMTGEGHPVDEITARGCQPVDIGYNVEESMPSLLRYAMESGDDYIYGIVVKSLRSHLEFMLPDGAWDNSFGTRNFKWTYWGSRTSDGCQVAYAVLGRKDAVFAEAARRNVELYAACTHDGLLYGGPHYQVHGEKPCIHHTFCHAKALATALDSGLVDMPRVALPSDNAPALRHYSEIDTYRIAAGDYRADVTGYDLHYMDGGHTSGGGISLLWHRKTGPILLTGMIDYSLKEPHNMQLSLNKAAHKPLAPRVELFENGARYSQIYDYGADISAREAEGGVDVVAVSALVDMHQHSLPERVTCRLEYSFTAERVRITGTVSPSGIGRAVYVLPVIAAGTEECVFDAGMLRVPKSNGAVLHVSSANIAGAPELIFNLCGGFEARELKLVPDETGKFAVEIHVE